MKYYNCLLKMPDGTIQKSTLSEKFAVEGAYIKARVTGTDKIIKGMQVIKVGKALSKEKTEELRKIIVERDSKKNFKS